MADVTTSGPLYDGSAYAALGEGVDAVRRQVSQRGQQLVMAAFTAQMHRDTGRFLHSVTTTRTSRTYSTASGHKSYTMPVIVEDAATDELVTTDIASYGPWLEGVGSRNDTTRFKGYHGFRIAGQELDRVAGVIADDALIPYVRRMN